MAQSVEGLVLALFESGGDRSGSVRESAGATLRTLGAHQPPLVLRAAHQFLARQPKLAPTHRGFVLGAVDAVCADQLVAVDAELAGLIINLATQEMTMAKETQAEWQGRASDVLVTLARPFSTCVMDSLLQKFQPGCSPHPYVVRTLGMLARNNPFGFVPFLSDVMSRTIPMLGTVKGDAAKCTFAVALGQYAEAVCEYVSGIADAPDPSVTKDVYASQMEAAYDMLWAWMSGRDYQLRATIAHSLGQLAHLLAKEKLHEELRRLVPAMLSLYKRALTDSHVLTLGLCRLLEAATEDSTSPLEPYLEETWVTLFPQVCESCDSVNPDDVRNHNEVLRCFNVTAWRFADRLVYYLIQKMQSSQERYKLGGISIMRHLLNSSASSLADKQSLVVHGLRPVFADSTASVRVRRALCQLALALADHDYLQTDGGAQVVEFVVRNLVAAADPPTKKGSEQSDAAAASQLRAQCGQALLTIAKRSEGAHQLLWPKLLEFVCVETYTCALADLCRCLDAVLVNVPGLALSYVVGAPMLDNARVPAPPQLFVRLVVIASGPLQSESRRASAALQLLHRLSASFHPALVPIWDVCFPSLFEKMQNFQQEAAGGNAEVAQRSWEAALLSLVGDSVGSVGDGEWRTSLAAAAGKQFALYDRFHCEKRFLCRCLGGLLSKIVNAQFVVSHLELMFKSVNHAKAIEREGCAQSVGYCATVHTDIVLTKLENLAKWEHQKKTAGLFNFLKDSMSMRGDSEMDCGLRATILLSYGYLLLYCSADTVTQRLESTVLVFLKPYFESAKDVVVKESLLSTISMIAQTVHPDHLNAEYTLAQRKDLLLHVKAYVQSEGAEVMTSAVRLHALRAVAQLVSLNPALSESEIWTSVGALCSAVYPLTSVKLSDATADCSVDTCVDALHRVFEELLKKLPTSPMLTTLLKLIQPWLSAEVQVERVRAYRSSEFLLRTYYNLASDCILGCASVFPLIGSIFARYGPRLCDPQLAVRSNALQCIVWTIKLAGLHKGYGKDYANPIETASAKLAERINSMDTQSQLQAVQDMSKTFEQQLPDDQLQTYLSVLFDVLTDGEASVGCAAAVLLRLTVASNGEKLSSEAEKIASTLLDKLAVVRSLQTYAETLQSMAVLASHHLATTLSVLLAQPLPLNQQAVDAWHVVARDDRLFPAVLNFVLQVMDNSGNEKYEVLDGSTVKSAKLTQLTTVAALTELLKGGEPESVLVEEVPRVLISLLLTCGALVEAQFPFGCAALTADLRKSVASPAALVNSAMRALFFRLRFDSVIHDLNERHAWTNFEDCDRIVASTLDMAQSLASHQPRFVEQTVDLCEAQLDSACESRRVVAVAVLSAFVGHACGDGGRGVLLERLVAAMMRGLADASMRVRKLCVRGMGEVAHADAERMAQYATPALSAVMAGLDDAADHADEVALEAMLGLSKLSARVSRTHLDGILVNVLLRIRPCLDKESSALRQVAFNLLADLARFSDNDAYREQMQTNMVCVLLHAYDSAEPVQKAAGRVLRAFAPLLHNTEISRLLDSQMSVECVVFDYPVFLSRLAKPLVQQFSDRINFYALCCSNYFKSASPRIRANAALLTGALLGSATAQLRSTISKELIFTGLSLLLKDSEEEVRQAAVEAIACLYDF